MTHTDDCADFMGVNPFKMFCVIIINIIIIVRYSVAKVIKCTYIYVVILRQGVITNIIF